MTYPTLTLRPLALALSSLALASSLSAQSVVFQPDFAGTYTGGGANQFTGQYQAASGAYSTLSVVGDRFQFQSNHDPALNTAPAGDGWNQSATQLSRNKDSAALPFVSNVGIVEFNWRWNDNVWASGDQSVLNFQIGENFRTGAFNPSGGGGNGPSFASVSLQARSTDGEFRFIAGGGPGSSNFDLTRDGDGFFNASVFMAFNNSGSVQSLTAPDGAYNLDNESLAVWVNGTSVWSNYTHGTNIRPAADFENIGFGFGNGTNNIFDVAETVGGTTQLYDISISTIPEPSAFAALVGLAVLGLAATRRRHHA